MKKSKTYRKYGKIKKMKIIKAKYIVNYKNILSIEGIMQNDKVHKISKNNQ